MPRIPRGMKRSKRARSTVVKITSQGQDFKGSETTVHVRREGDRITADVFDNKIKNADAAHITSESFPYTKAGAKQVTEFVNGEGNSSILAI